MVRRHARKTGMMTLAGLGQTDGGSEKNERSDELHDVVENR